MTPPAAEPGPGEDQSERPAAGPRQTDDDVASSLPPGAGRKADTGGRGDVDRLHPYDEAPTGLRMEDAPLPEPEPPRD